MGDPENNKINNIGTGLVSAHGITLITLIITIIILLILAGIIINLTIGDNGLFSTAKKAKEEYLNAQTSEEEGLNSLYSEMLVATGDDSKITISVEELNKLIDERVAMKENKEIEDLSNNVTFNTTYIDTTANSNYISVIKYGNLVQVSFVLNLKTSITNSDVQLMSGLPSTLNNQTIYFIGNAAGAVKSNYVISGGGTVYSNWSNSTLNTTIRRFNIIYDS